MVTGGKILKKSITEIPVFICGLLGVWGILKVKSKYLSKYYV